MRRFAKFTAAGALLGFFCVAVSAQEGPAPVSLTLKHTLEQPGIGTYLMPGSPLAFAGCDRLPPRRAPMLGEHTDEVLGDILGLSDAAIGRLHDDGIVAGPVPVPVPA